MKFLKSVLRVVRAPLTQIAVTKLAQVAQKPGISSEERLALDVVSALLKTEVGSVAPSAPTA